MYFPTKAFYVSIDPEVPDKDIVAGLKKGRVYLAIGTELIGNSPNIMIISENKKLLFLPLHHILFEGFKRDDPLPENKVNKSEKKPVGTASGKGKSK